MHISLAAETLFTLWGIPITNTLLVSWAIMALFFALVFATRVKLAGVPGSMQNAVELVIEKLLGFMETVTGSRKEAIQAFPIVATIFFFVLFSNFVEIIPGLGTIGMYAEKEGHRVFLPFLRSASADLNFTLALAISAVVGVQVMGIAAVGFFAHWKKFFFPPWEKPYLLGTFIGVLELVAEIAKMVSFSFRLFGNIFAGEVLLTVVAVLVPFVAPLPFLLLEIFVGVVQAVVFSMLTLVFIKVARTHH